MNQKLVSRIDALREAFIANRIDDLKHIGRDSIEDAAVEQSYELAKVSVIAYCLYKIRTKRHFTKSPRWNIVEINIAQNLSKSKIAAEKNDYKVVKIKLEKVISEIQFIDNQLSHYAMNIYEKAKIKQASVAYASGISLSQAASLTGADKKDLQQYIGATRIHDEQVVHHGIQERLEKIEELL